MKVCVCARACVLECVCVCAWTRACALMLACVIFVQVCLPVNVKATPPDRGELAVPGKGTMLGKSEEKLVLAVETCDAIVRATLRPIPTLPA